MAAGFLAAALYMRVAGLIVPGIIVGANGLLFQFCVVTGLWDVWSVMWTIEPLSVGVALLLLGGLKKRRGTMLAGLILCAVSGVGLVGTTAIVSMTTLFAGWWLFKLVGPALLVLTGVLVLVFGLTRNVEPAPKPR